MHIYIHTSLNQIHLQDFGGPNHVKPCRSEGNFLITQPQPRMTKNIREIYNYGTNADVHKMNLIFLSLTSAAFVLEIKSKKRNRFCYSDNSTIRMNPTLPLYKAEEMWRRNFVKSSQ